jgi:hypothetical protein
VSKVEKTSSIKIGYHSEAAKILRETKLYKMALSRLPFGSSQYWLYSNTLHHNKDSLDRRKVYDDYNMQATNNTVQQ